MIDIHGIRAHHFGEPALGDAAQDFHLTEAKMGVNQAKREGEIGVCPRLDERDLVLIPVNDHVVLDRCAFDWQRGQAVC